MPGTYPTLLTAGLTNLGRFDQFDLFAGEDDIVTSQAQAADGQAILQFQPLSFDANGRLVPWDASGEGYASGTLTFTGQPVAADTVTINGVVIDFVATATPGDDDEVVIGATAVATVAALIALLNGTPDGVNLGTNNPTYGISPLAGTGVTATVDATGLIVTLHAIVPGTAGNSITLTEAATNVAASAATLTGGAAESVLEPKQLIGIAAQPVSATTPGTWLPYFIGGVFNHEVLVWPGSVATLAQRKRAVAGSAIKIGQLL